MVKDGGLGHTIRNSVAIFVKLTFSLLFCHFNVRLQWLLHVLRDTVKDYRACRHMYFHPNSYIQVHDQTEQSMVVLPETKDVSG